MILKATSKAINLAKLGFENLIKQSSLGRLSQNQEGKASHRCTVVEKS